MRRPACRVVTFMRLMVVPAVLLMPAVLVCQTVNINVNSIVTPYHHGFGVQFHSDQFLTANKLIYKGDDAQWENYWKPTFRTIKPKLMKMSLPVSYWCPSLGQVTPDSDWMQALYKVLDFFRDEGIEIQFQEWRHQDASWAYWHEIPYAPPEEIENFAKYTADMLRHLTLEKGYWNIRTMCIYNEPSNYFSSNGLLDAVYFALRRYMDEYHVPVTLNAPDSVQINRQQDWRELMRHCFTVLDSACEEYSFNCYSGIFNYDAYTEPRAVVQDEATNSLDGNIEPVFIYEGETGNQQSGASEGRYYVDVMRAGIAGVTKWWCWDHYFVFSCEVNQSGASNMVNWNGTTYVPRDQNGGNYLATVLGCSNSYNAARVLGTTVSGASGLSASVLKDIDSDSYSIYVWNGGSAANVTFTINVSTLTRVFEKYVWPAITPGSTVSMTNGSMTTNIGGSSFVILRSTGPRDSAAPTNPTGLTATVLSPRKVRLSWNQGTDNARVLRYNIYRSDRGSTPVISVRQRVQKVQHVWEDLHVNPGTAYTYTVKTVDGAGNESAGVTVAVNTPNAVSGAPSVPQNVKVVDALAEIELEWTPSTDDNRVAGYRVYERIQGESGVRVAEITGNPPRAWYFSTNGKAWCRWENSVRTISVTAFDDEGNESAHSSSVTVRTPYGYTFDWDDNWEFFNDGYADYSVEVPLRTKQKKHIITGTDSNLRTAAFGFTPSQIKQVYLRFRNTTTRNQLRVAWFTANNDETPAGYIDIPITANDTTFKDYLVDLTQSAAWNSLSQVTRMMIDFRGTTGTGDVWFEYMRIGTFPMPRFSVTPSNPNAGQSVTFNASGSTPPPGGSITAYEWDFGDGQTGTGQTVNHTFAQPGQYTVRLIARQNDLIWMSTQTVVLVGNPAPLQVQGLKAFDYSRNRIDLEWTANPESDIASYRVYRGMTAGFVPGAGTLIGQTTQTWYLSKGLSPTTKYFYKVTAVDTASQEGPASAAVECTTRQYDTIVVNGEWETGNRNPWGGGTNWTVSTGRPHDGTYSLYGNGVIGELTQTVNVTTGTQYRFACYIYIQSHTPSGGGSENFAIYMRHPSWNPTYTAVKNIVRPVGQWFPLTMEFVPTSNQLYIQILNWNSDTYQIYLDDIIVDRVPDVVGSSQPPAGSPPAAPGTLRVNGQANPVGVNTQRPVLSWVFSDPDAGDTQGMYEVLVSSTLAQINANVGGMWASGQVVSAQSSATYNGQSLRQGTTYYWKVRVWDNTGLASSYSAVGTWVTFTGDNPPNGPTNLRCDGAVTPSTVTNTTPVLSWVFSDPDPGDVQTAWQVLVSSVAADLTSDIGGAWNSTVVPGAGNQATYNGVSLQPGVTYYWKVRTWDVWGVAGAWSAVSWWTMQNISNEAPAVPANLRCDGQENPVNVTNTTPRLSWVFSDPDGNQQGSYQVLVSSNPANLTANIGDAWDSGRVYSSTSAATYNGTSLRAGTTYYWKVRVWDSHPQLPLGSGYSGVATFTMFLSSNQAPNAPDTLRCDGQVNPVGIINFTPTLSWNFSDPDTGNLQGAYQILVSSVPAQINANVGGMWDTGKTTSAATAATYAGRALQPNTTYYWKVRVWDNDPVLQLGGPYSAAAQFITGIPAGPATRLEVMLTTGAAVAGSGTQVTAYVRARDANGLVATGYQGTADLAFRIGTMPLFGGQATLTDGVGTHNFIVPSTATTLTVTASAAGLASSSATFEVLIRIEQDTFARTAFDNGQTRMLILGYTFAQDPILPKWYTIAGRPLADAQIALPADVTPIPNTGRDLWFGDRRNGGTPITETNYNGKHIRVTVLYPDTNNDGVVDGTGRGEGDVWMYQWDEQSSRWVACALTEIDPYNNTATGYVMPITKVALGIRPESATPPPVRDPFVDILRSGEVAVQGNAQGYVDLSQGNAAVQVRFRPKSSGPVTMKVYSLRGGLVYEAGAQGVADQVGRFPDWRVQSRDGETLAAGIYLVKISGGGLDITKRIAVVK